MLALLCQLFKIKEYEKRKGHVTDGSTGKSVVEPEAVKILFVIDGVPDLVLRV